ncbi:MAG: hypothetical protein LBM20_02855 [Rikenellaceae bacterium]|jgi:hypothetical protein|nr:hypothetical protein [Rikenellaceae bacterium]
MIDDTTRKFRQYRTLVYLLAFVILFEMGMLMLAVPAKTTFIWFTLAVIAFLCLYLIVLCLRLIRELQETKKL